MSSQEEYGLRCLLQLARQEDRLVSISEIAGAEGISPEYAAKILRVLRQGGLVESTRGASGGYRLARPSHEVTIADAVQVLDGPLIAEDFCDTHTGKLQSCVHTTNCSLRALLGWINRALDAVLENITLADLAGGEHATRGKLVELDSPVKPSFPHRPAERPAPQGGDR